MQIDGATAIAFAEVIKGAVRDDIGASLISSRGQNFCVGGDVGSSWSVALMWADCAADG